jgi:hypothetical protein
MAEQVTIILLNVQILCGMRGKGDEGNSRDYASRYTSQGQGFSICNSGMCRTEWLHAGEADHGHGELRRSCDDPGAEEIM